MWQQDPSQEWMLDTIRTQKRRDLTAFEQFATEFNAVNVAQFSERYPTASAELALGITQGGIPAMDPIVQSMVDLELQNRRVNGPVEEAGGGWWDPIGNALSELVVDPVKGAARYTMGAFQAAWELTGGGLPIRAAQMSAKEGIGYWDAWKAQDPALFEALGGIVSDVPGTLMSTLRETVTPDEQQMELHRTGNLKYTSNLGSGYFAGGTVAPDVQENVMAGMEQLNRETAQLPPNAQFTERLMRSPQVWEDAVAASVTQQSLGNPLQQMSSSAAESVMFQLPNGNVTPWSPGRVTAAMAFEPGTDSFKYASGFLDFTAQLALDPTNYVAGWWAKAGMRGRAVWAQARKMDDAQNTLDVIKALPPGAPTPQALPMSEMAARQILDDESIQLATGLRLQVGDEAGFIAPVRPDVFPAGLPDDDFMEAGRVLRPTDPPQFFVDAQHQATKRLMPEVEEMQVNKMEAGVYQVAGVEGTQYDIIKRGRKWIVKDRRRNKVGEYPTLKAATEGATEAAGRQAQDPRIFGMSRQEFVDTGEDLWLGDDFVHSWRQRTAGRAPSNPKFSRYKAGKPEGGNARSRVFGQTADLSTGDATGLPEGLQAALRKDRKLRQGRYVGFGDPDLEKLDNTRAWMRENGYGKLKFDDDNYLVIDEFIGGNPDDPLGRVFFDAGDKPIENYRPYDMPDEGMTPNQVNEMIDGMLNPDPEEIDWMGVRNAMNPATREGVRTARQATHWRQSLLDSARPAVDRPQLTHELAGHKGSTVQKFTSRLFAASRAGGAESTGKLDNMLRFFDKKGLTVPRQIRRALYDAADEEEAGRIFASWLGAEGGPGMITLPGGLQYGRLGAIDAAVGGALSNGKIPGLITRTFDRPAFTRRMASMLPTDPLDVVNDPDKAYVQLNNILANFNVKRGDVIEQLDGPNLSIDDIFDRLAAMRAGDKTEAFDIMGDYSEFMMAKMVDDGISPELSRIAKGWWNEVMGEAIYDAERLGRVDLDVGTGELMKVGDDLVHMSGPQLTSEAWTGLLHFPPRSEFRRVMNESDALGRVANTLTTKRAFDDQLGRTALQDRAWYMYTSALMNQVWKPFVLLRGAWTARIWGDDQLRMAAEGLDSVWNSPLRILNYALTRDKNWRRNWGNGVVDVNGTLINKANLDEMGHATEFRKSLMQQSDPQVGTGAFGYRSHKRVARGQAGYSKGLASDHAFLAADPVTKSMATSNATDPVAEATNWLLGKGPARSREQGLRLRQQFADLQRNEEIAQLVRDGDQQTLYNVMSGLYARLHRKTGGRVMIDNGSGQLLDYATLTARGEAPEVLGTARWVIESPGDPELLTIIGDAKINGLSLNTTEGFDELAKFVSGKVDLDETGRWPDFVAAPDMESMSRGAMGPIETANNAVRKGFEWAMAIPSDKFSRMPVFRQAYWRTVGERLPFMTDELRATILARARKIGLEDQVLKWGEETRKIVGDGVAGQLNDIDQLDMYAKGAGLAQVEETLFDLANKKNISESLNLVFPFIEAWGEFLSRWSRLMVTGDRAMKNSNRLRQGVNGARSSGFFYENEYGEEVFAYPAFLTKAQVQLHNTMNNLPGLGNVLGGDVDPEMADRLKSTGRAQGLNFMAGVIPGFGPVFQMGAKQILSDDPKWDGVKGVIAPYGMEGGAVAQFAPAWVKRVVSALGGREDPALTYTYSSTVQDVMRTMIDRGDFAGVTRPEEINKLIAEAEEKAKGVLMVRAAATWWQPTSPSYTWEKEDVTGMVWSYSNLGNEYRKIREEVGGDDIAAFDTFYSRFGFLPSAFTQGRTYQVQPRAITEEGWKFEREHPEYFAKYPSTAVFLDPTQGEETTYDHGVMIRRLQQAEAEAWTAEQYVYLQQDQAGDLMWDHVNRTIPYDATTESRNATLAEAREYIENLYPYWRQEVPGKRQSVTNEEQRAEMQGWLQDPDVMATPIGQAVREYETEREVVLERLNSLGLTTIDGAKKSPDAQAGRAWLRNKAQEIEARVPAFMSLWRNVYADEVRAEIDTPTAEKEWDVDLYGSGYFAETYGVSS